MDISLPASGFACSRQSPGKAVAPVVQLYPAARPCRFARTGQTHAVAADGPIGPGSHQPGAPGRGRNTRGQVELAEDIGQVPVHRVLAQHQPPGDVRVAQSLRDEPVRARPIGE